MAPKRTENELSVVSTASAKDKEPDTATVPPSQDKQPDTASASLPEDKRSIKAPTSLLKDRQPIVAPAPAPWPNTTASATTLNPFQFFSSENQRRPIFSSTFNTTQTFDETLLKTLEISAYDLAILKEYLKTEDMLAKSTDEEALDDAVLRFRKSYNPESLQLAPRLKSLFEVWTDAEVEKEVRTTYEISGTRNWAGEHFALVIDRETKNYNAVRSLIADLTARKLRREEVGSQK